MGSFEALDAAFAQHLGAVQHAAFASPAGGGPGWDATLAHYGIAPLAPDERATIVSLMRLSRGAVPAELRTVLLGLKAWAERELEPHRYSGHPGVPAFAQRIASLVDGEMAAYERALGIAPSVPMTPPPPVAPAGAPSLASIFANAQSTAKEVPWANAKAHSGVLNLTCVHCGGPQEQPSDFMCKYCRRPIAGGHKPTI